MTQRHQLGASPLDLVSIARRDHNPEAGVRQRPGSCGTNPPAGAGHHRYPTGEGIHFACVALAPSSA
jgi:hypothetical protein